LRSRGSAKKGVANIFKGFETGLGVSQNTVGPTIASVRSSRDFGVAILIRDWKFLVSIEPDTRALRDPRSESPD